MDDRASLTGSLKFTSLPDLFQIFGGNSNTGVLKIMSRYAPNPGHIYFHNGDPVNADYGSANGLDALYMLFGITEGDFEFRQEPLQVKHSIQQNRIEIILNALKQIDDGKIKMIGPATMDKKLGQAETHADSGKNSPLIEGPLVNYAYVVKEEFFESGAEIVKEGAHGKWIWIILDGIVRVSRNIDGETMNIARLGKGCFIGTVKAMLYGEYSRTACITAEGEVSLGVVNANRLYMEYVLLSPEFKAVLLSMDNRLRKMTDRSAELFSGKNSADGLIGEKMVAFDNAELAESLYSIIQGEAVVVAQTPSGSMPLITLQERDFLGYLPFVDIGHEPRAASIMASADLVTDKINWKDIQGEYYRLSTTFRNFIYHLGTCISMTTAQMHGHEKLNS
jgi:CRP-like cAMP-binding protein